MTTGTNEPTVQAEQGSEELILSAQGLEKYYKQGTSLYDRIVGNSGHVKAVDGVDLSVREGEIVAVVGESGCGKTTLGRTILNLETPTGGEVYYKGENIAELSDRKMKPYRQKLQVIFQNPLKSLNPRKTVGQILKAPMEVHGIGADDGERTERARDLLDSVGLNSGYTNRYPHQFSGGQQQRIAIARALSLEPELLIADEPTSSLDVSVQSKILTLLDDLREERGLSVLFISHDLSTVRYIADRVNVMYLGEIIESAPTEELFENHQHPYTKSLLSSVPRIEASERSDRVVLQGTVPSPMNPPDGCRFHTRCPVVIPPDDWVGSQEAFKKAFDYRNRVLADEIDLDGVETQLRAADRDVTETAMVELLIDRVDERGDSELPDGAMDTIRRSAQALVAGQRTKAAELVEDAFSSRCERETPADIDLTDDHSAACHRVEGPRTDSSNG